MGVADGYTVTILGAGNKQTRIRLYFSTCLSGMYGANPAPTGPLPAIKSRTVMNSRLISSYLEPVCSNSLAFLKSASAKACSLFIS